jgi:hypothetical protein
MNPKREAPSFPPFASVQKIRIEEFPQKETERTKDVPAKSFASPSNKQEIIDKPKARSPFLSSVSFCSKKSESQNFHRRKRRERRMFPLFRPGFNATESTEPFAKSPFVKNHSSHHRVPTGRLIAAGGETLGYPAVSIPSCKDGSCGGTLQVAIKPITPMRGGGGAGSGCRARRAMRRHSARGSR